MSYSSVIKCQWMQLSQLKIVLSWQSVTQTHMDTQMDRLKWIWGHPLQVHSLTLICFLSLSNVAFFLIHIHIYRISQTRLTYCLYSTADGKKWHEMEQGTKVISQACDFMLCVSRYHQDAPHSHGFAQLRVSVWPEMVLGCEVSRLLFSGGAVYIIGMGRGHRSLSALP